MTDHDVPTPDGLDPEEHPVIDLTSDITLDLSAPDRAPDTAPDTEEPPSAGSGAGGDEPDMLELLMEDSLVTWLQP